MTPTLERLAALAAAHGLAPAGVAPIGPEDGPDLAGLASVALLAPGPDLWARFTAASEASDGAPHPLDRWSARVAEAIAAALPLEAGGRALTPFGGPPYRPFLRWARATGRVWASPIGPLIDAERGLWISYRAAIGLVEPPPPSPAPARPCDACVGRPCLTACPVDAFASGPDDVGAYDVAACKAHLATPAGADCMTLGCRARRACPVGAAHAPEPARTALHMRAFLGA